MCLPESLKGAVPWPRAQAQVDFETPPWPKISAEAKDCVQRLLLVKPEARPTAGELLQVCPLPRPSRDTAVLQPCVWACCRHGCSPVTDEPAYEATLAALGHQEVDRYEVEAKGLHLSMPLHMAALDAFRRVRRVKNPDLGS